MKTFNDLNFKPTDYRPGSYTATMDLDEYTISVIYGDGAYGKGPAYDTYEVAVFENGHDDPVPLSDESDVIGWQNAEEITSLMKILQTEPAFGTCVRLLKRTKYSRRFLNISHMRDSAFV